MSARFGAATRQVLALILPSMVGFLILASTAMTLLLRHGGETAAEADLAASVLALFALGLPGYCVFFLATRTFQAMQDTRTACLLYLLENGVNIVLAIVLYQPLGVKGLALSYSIAYTVAAIASLVVLRERLGSIGGRLLVKNSIRSFVLSVLMAFAVALASAVLGTSGGFIGWVKLLVSVLAGIVVYVGTAGLAGSFSGWQNARRKQPSAKERYGQHSSRHR